jgi:hypothetical protein
VEAADPKYGCDEPVPLTNFVGYVEEYGKTLRAVSPTALVDAGPEQQKMLIDNTKTPMNSPGSSHTK